ncbi:hypothetical protein AALP_AA5G116400 [Arabis alpina]|uniref:Uncharacterized protein n=1 Tax=Arabis alpina TaxID=50452 RepID=A0A087GWH0_ARAAL|nr:hypothetical protein AALP_AA5G116400 [Arabis alpina]
MEPHNVVCDLESLRRLYSLLQSNTNNEPLPQPFLLDENTQFVLKRLLDSATKELLATQSNILAQVEQLRLPEKVRGTKVKRESVDGT